MFLNAIPIVSSSKAVLSQAPDLTPREKTTNPTPTRRSEYPTPRQLLFSPRPTQPIDPRSPQPHYIILTITSFSSTYTTTILLGNTFLASPTSESTTSNILIPQIPGIPTGTIVGIVVGCVLGFLALGLGFYAYVLKAKRDRRRRRRARGSSKSRSTRSSSGESSGAGVSKL